MQGCKDLSSEVALLALRHLSPKVFQIDDDSGKVQISPCDYMGPTEATKMTRPHFVAAVFLSWCWDQGTTSMGIARCRLSSKVLKRRALLKVRGGDAIAEGPKELLDRSISVLSINSPGEIAASMIQARDAVVPARCLLLR